MKVRNVILLVAMAVELVLFFYCLIKKTNHVPAGYLCAALSLALLACTGWLLLFPKMTPVETTGEYEVGYEENIYIDTNRLETYATDGSYRELPVGFWYPKDISSDKKCPLIVFSHGSFGVKDSNSTLYRELASHGYVVCSIDHTYMCFSTKLSNGKKVSIDSSFMKQLTTDNPHNNPEQSVEHFKNWMSIRMGDINFVLDTILAKASEGDAGLASYALVDGSRIGVMGHSMGGSAALGVGRSRTDIKAVAALESPFMADIQGVDENGNMIFEQSEYPVPVLNVYSDSSWEHLREWGQYEENARLLDTESADVQNVHISGAGHISLTDLSMVMPFLTGIFDGGKMKNAPQDTLKQINECCLAFFDSYM
ncbi:MAG: hypothetical protein PUD20_08120 [bacterium]|nr:hypothetical protein [bacterium]